ncbi:hypothetical protein Q7P35_001949 [Cladosporium inversicolor]
MTETSCVEDNKAFIAAILALEALIRNEEDAAFAAEHFSEILATQRFRSDTIPNRKSTSAPALDEPLPLELRALVDKYHAANEFVLEKLIEHGGFDLAYDEVNDGRNETKWRVRSLVHKDRDNVDQAMTVQYKQAKTCDGRSGNVPYIFGNQYLDLFYSMIRRQHLSRGALGVVLGQIAGQLEIAIAARQTLHDWHVLLPAADVRVKDNHSHAVFLHKLKILRQAISRQIQ